MINKNNYSEFEALQERFNSNTNPKSANSQLRRYSIINYPVISGGRYEYTPTESDNRPDEHLDTIDDQTGKGYIDGKYWCDTGSWDWGPFLVSPPSPGPGILHGTFSAKK